MMLPEYLRRIAETAAGKDNKSMRRYVIGRDPRAVVWGDPAMLEKFSQLVSDVLPDRDYSLKQAKKYETDFIELVTVCKKNKGNIPEYGQIWQVVGQRLTPYNFLGQLGVIAFLNGKDGGEAFFRLDRGKIFPLDKPISFSEAAVFLEYFYGPGSLVIYDLPLQYNRAQSLVGEWINFERWLESFRQGEEKRR